jgi:hypothetical protein
MFWTITLLLLVGLPTLVFLAWIFRKIYLRVTDEFLQIIFVTSTGRKIKVGPLEITQTNLSSVSNLLTNNEVSILSFGNLILPKQFVINCTIEQRIVRRFSLEDSG